MRLTPGRPFPETRLRRVSIRAPTRTLCTAPRDTIHYRRHSRARLSPVTGFFSRKDDEFPLSLARGCAWWPLRALIFLKVDYSGVCMDLPPLGPPRLVVFALPKRKGKGKGRIGKGRENTEEKGRQTKEGRETVQSSVRNGREEVEGERKAASDRRGF